MRSGAELLLILLMAFTCDLVAAQPLESSDAVVAVPEATMNSLTPEKEQACFERSLDMLENYSPEVNTVTVARANAWTQGYVDELRAVGPEPEPQQNPCNLNPVQNDVLDIEAFEQQSKQKWLDAAELALANNQTTFAVLRMNELFSEDGFLAKLRAKGYSIREPE